jgi:hypothetical protein
MDLLEILMHPLTALIVGLLLGAIAVSGKFSQHAANIMLSVAWIVGVYAAMRSGVKDPRILLIGICFVTILVLVISLWIRPTNPPPSPPEVKQESGINAGDRSSPKLALHIDMTIIDGVKERPHVYVILVVAVSNSPTGAPSIAEGWRLRVVDPTSNKELKAQLVLAPESISVPTGTGKTITMPGDPLYQKAMTPITGGEKIRGILTFELTEIDRKQLPDKLHLELYCKDIVGTEISTSVNWRWGSGDKLKYFPGLGTPKIK